MFRQPQEFVTCPLDPSHRMPAHRLQWHMLSRCKAARENQLYRCSNDYSHVFLDQAQLQAHEAICPASRQAAPEEMPEWPSNDFAWPSSNAQEGSSQDENGTWGDDESSTMHSSSGQMAIDSEGVEPAKQQHSKLWGQLPCRHEEEEKKYPQLQQTSQHHQQWTQQMQVVHPRIEDQTYWGSNINSQMGAASSATIYVQDQGDDTWKTHAVQQQTLNGLSVRFGKFTI